MKTLKKFVDLIREVIDLIIKFLKPYGLKDELLKIPNNVKKIGFRVGIMNLAITIIALIFAFFLKITNIAIESKFILVGIIFFMLYRGQEVIKEAFWLFQSSETKKFEMIFNDEVVLRGSNIIGKVANKVFKWDNASNIYKMLNNEAVLNTIKEYLKNVWRQEVQHVFDIFEITSVIAMLGVAIIANTVIPQYIFIPLIMFFAILSFFVSAYINLNREEFYKKHREYNSEQSVIVNDLLRVPIIVKDDLEMRISKFQKTVIASNSNISKFHKKINLSRLIIAVIEALSQYGIIVFYLINVEWNSISLDTITQISANIIIIETALDNIRQIAETLNTHNERLIIIEKEESDMNLILDVYNNEERQNNSKTKGIENIRIDPFLIQYVKGSENDTPFTLTSEEVLEIKKGEIAILTGVSGSGKSTFMKLLTQRIRLEGSSDIPSTSRYLFYDEKLKLGSFNIYEELFCCEENPNLPKMQEILNSLHLWTEIKSNCIDVWKWMQENKFENNLSNGQKQRLIIAKMLYWLDETIDVVALDECTSGLDDKSKEDSADAQRILEYIVRYCNKDKKRIIIISTHQNIDGFKEKLSQEYIIKNLHFEREGNKNIIRKN